MVLVGLHYATPSEVHRVPRFPFAGPLLQHLVLRGGAGDAYRRGRDSSAENSRRREGAYD